MRKLLACLVACGFLEVFLCNVNKELQVGADCEPPTGGSGVCVLDRECPHLMGYNRHDFRFYRTRCQANDASLDLIVCCPARKSFKMCVRYGNKPDEPLLVEKIQGGVEVIGHEIPQFAALAYESDETKDSGFEVNCGGVLISDRFVLTATHCLKRHLKVVRLGIYTLDAIHPEDDAGNIDVGVKRRIKHPQYNSVTKDNDIALIELEKPVNFTYSVWPACLTDDEEFDSNVDLTIAGFGLKMDRSRGGKKSTWLMKASVQKISREECIDNYTQLFGATHRYTKGITDTLLCAKNRLTDANTCQGDSGSGIFFNADRSTKSFVVGITSYGMSCNSNLPSFYTRVQKYLDWIEGHVWPESETAS